MEQPSNEYDAMLDLTLIATAMADPLGCAEVIAELPSEAFFLPQHALIWDAIKGVFASGKEVDTALVYQEIKARGYEAEISMTSGMPAGTFIATICDEYSGHPSVNSDLWAKHVRDKWDRRRANGVGRLLASAALEETKALSETLSEATNKILEIAAGQDSKSSASIGDLVKSLVAELDDHHQNPERDLGLSTGFQDIDNLFGGGLQPGNQYVLAARPSMGKTAMALDWLLRASVKGVPSLLFSLEMTNEQVRNRIVANLARVDLQDISKLEVRPKDYNRLLRAVSTLHDTPLIVDESGVATLAYIRAKAIEQQMRRGLGLIVIDYLQLMHEKADNREREIAQLARGTKTLAKELKVPVVVLSQLNRSCETRANKRPLLSDLRESGAIEQDADVVAFLYRDDYYNEDTDKPGIAELIVGKNRNGPTGTIELRWLDKCTRFESIQRGHLRAV